MQNLCIFCSFLPLEENEFPRNNNRRKKFQEMQNLHRSIFAFELLVTSSLDWNWLFRNIWPSIWHCIYHISYSGGNSKFDHRYETRPKNFFLRLDKTQNAKYFNCSSNSNTKFHLNCDLILTVSIYTKKSTIYVRQQRRSKHKRTTAQTTSLPVRCKYRSWNGPWIKVYTSFFCNWNFYRKTKVTSNFVSKKQIFETVSWRFFPSLQLVYFYRFRVQSFNVNKHKTILYLFIVGETKKVTASIIQ